MPYPSFLALLISLLLVGCDAHQPTTSDDSRPVKNIILMIGDGMGPQQLGLLQSYANRAPNSRYQGRPTAMQQLMNQGKLLLSDTSPHNALVVDSACSATQLATGVTSGSEMIGLDYLGNPVETLLQHAKRSGKVTGLISDTRITHATPASFAAHQPHRSLEANIAVDLLANQVDLMLSGGLGFFLPANTTTDTESSAFTAIAERIQHAGQSLRSRRKDERNLLLDAQQQGYQLAFDRQQLLASQQLPLLGLFANSGMENAIRYHRLRESGAERQQPSLKEMTVKALDLLSQHPDGFVLMIEGGQIDWAGHNNDVGSMLHELLRFDEAIQAVVDWVQERDDTLVVVTADHETGSFGFSYSAVDIPEPSTLPGSGFAEHTYAPNFNFGDLSLLDRIHAQKKDFYDVWAEAIANGDDGRVTTDSLVNAVNNNLAFRITHEQAERILARHKNPFQRPGHRYLSSETLPKVHDFTPFYVYGDDIHLNLLARELAAQQNTVWGTGTHTATPVPVIVYGPSSAQEAFQGYLHHAQVGALLKSFLP
ncbi:MAG: alkaline phosphatase [Bacterioplanes sp.]|nr:alkaline phosphatase [Bacterioplanes sp.]